MSIFKPIFRSVVKPVAKTLGGADFSWSSDCTPQLILTPDVYTEEMDATTGWGVTGTGGSLEVNTDQKYSGVASLKVTSGLGQDVNLSKIGHWDFSSDEGKSFRARIFMHSDITNSISVFFSKDSSLSHYFKFTYYVSPSQGYDYKTGVWNLLNVPGSKTTSGSPSWSDIGYIRIKINALAGQVNSCSFDLLQQGRVRQPAIVISFDGAYTSHYTKAYQLMKARRMRGTIYVTSNSVNTAGHNTTAQLQEMNASGWDIANHSTTHPDFTTLTEEEVIAELQGCEDFLTGIGCTRAVKHVAYPIGLYNDTVLSAMLTWGAKTGRRARGYKGDYDFGWPYELKSVAHTQTTTAADYIANIDKFISNNQIPNVFFHILVDNGPLGVNDWLESDFITVLDAIEARGLQTLTIDEYYRLYSGGITVHHK